MSELSVAIVGASRDRRKFGNKAVRADREAGLEVFPVHPDAGLIENLVAFASVTDITAKIDVVSLYVPPAVGLRLLPQIAECSPRELWLNPGATSDDTLNACTHLRLRPIVGCSIRALGLSPSQFPDE